MSFNNSIPIYFYIPKQYFPESGIPEQPNVYWHQFNLGITPGVYAWTIQTYQYLKADGLNCQLVGELPAEGIVFAHRKSLPTDFKPNDRTLIVCLKAESSAHPYAQIHVVGNEKDLDYQNMIFGDRYLYPNQKFYLPHWRQPGLIPRNSSRQEKFENIAFFGESQNLASQLRGSQWRETLANMGLQWHIVGKNRSHTWNDYSYIDCIVAVRQFDTEAKYTWKPALKLYNAWHAGVPAILGQESAYREARRNELDYIEVATYEELLAALHKLKQHPHFRQQMIANGFERARETSILRITALWQELIATEIIPAYCHWCKSASYRHLFLHKRELAWHSREQRKQLQQLRNTLGIRTRLRSTIEFYTQKKPF